MLAWAVYEERKLLLRADNWDIFWMKLNGQPTIFIKCHPEPDVYYYQVGDGDADHMW